MATASVKFARLAALKPVRAPAVSTTERRAPEEADIVARLLGAEVNRNHHGEHLSIRNWYSTPQFEQPSEAAIELLSCVRDESLSRRMQSALENPEKWLFLDTETTGLAGGTGTYAFLVGLGWWDAGGLQIEQFFMRDFAEEYSLLYELAGRIAERPVLVTFNGKAFDWPLLESRFTMTRSIPLPKLAGHLDLLHPSRALWRMRLGSVRLIELERQVLDAERLGWRREDDVASALIPQYYFDYLRGGSAAPIAGVVRHNQMDLRGLGALLGKMNSLLTEEAASNLEMEGLDLFGLSRFLQRRGKAVRAQETCAEAIERGLPIEQDERARRELAQMARRRGDHERAAGIWQGLVKSPEYGAEACERLAMHFEREEKDLRRALQYAEMGVKKLRQKTARSRDPLASARLARQIDRLDRRIARLKRRETQRGALRLLVEGVG
jgi:uncharacterized protein YprB with RNaseH-like and TPR domain